MTKTLQPSRLTLGLSVSLLALSAALAGCERRSSDVPAPTTTPGSSTGTTGSGTTGSGTTGSGTTGSGTTSTPPASAASQ